MNYLADPGGHFESDTHRRVLGHLSYPDDNYGWTANALLNRMMPDGATNVSSVEEMQGLLDVLEHDGHAQRVQTDRGDVWKMTQQGFDTLTGPIPQEPPPGAAVQGPAMVGLGATPLVPTPTDGTSGQPGIPTDEPPPEQAQAGPGSDQTGGNGAGSNPS